MVSGFVWVVNSEARCENEVPGYLVDPDTGQPTLHGCWGKRAHNAPERLLSSCRRPNGSG
jgi:hypothetical protein